MSDMPHFFNINMNFCAVPTCLFVYLCFFNLGSRLIIAGTSIGITLRAANSSDLSLYSGERITIFIHFPYCNTVSCVWIA